MLDSLCLLEDKLCNPLHSLDTADSYNFDVNMGCSMGTQWFGSGKEYDDFHPFNKPLDEWIDEKICDYSIINDFNLPDLNHRMNIHNSASTNILQNQNHPFDNMNRLFNGHYPLREKNNILENLELNVYESVQYNSANNVNMGDPSDFQCQRHFSDGSTLDVYSSETGDQIDLNTARNIPLEHHHNCIQTKPLPISERFNGKENNLIGLSVSPVRYSIPSSGRSNQCRKKKQLKFKENDPCTTAKREKHNEMEKLRRRVVANGFDILSTVLGMKGNRKPSKANILVKAREQVKYVDKNVKLVDNLMRVSNNERDQLIRRINSYL